MKKFAAILSLILALLVCLCACEGTLDEATTEAPETSAETTIATVEAEGLWADAVYTEDTTLGEGEKSVTVKFTLEEKSITFTILTDKEILGDALTDNALVEGEQGAYGLYIKKVNGITADYDTDGAYWGFFIDGEYAATGVDSTTITDGAVYELSYTKQLYEFTCLNTENQ